MSKNRPEICLAAVLDVGFALRPVKEQSLKICSAAIFNNKLAADYIRCNGIGGIVIIVLLAIIIKVILKYNLRY